jgi:hypothetical protein
MSKWAGQEKEEQNTHHTAAVDADEPTGGLERFLAARVARWARYLPAVVALGRVVDVNILLAEVANIVGAELFLQRVIMRTGERTKHAPWVRWQEYQ